jgi:putative methyltransferase (TIGR04325 family)
MSTMRALLDLPLLRTLRKARFDRRFATPAGGGACRGAYASFAEAARAVPSSAAHGYDTAPAAAMYRDRLSQLYAADYPVVYWLSRIARPTDRLLDFGGHVGVSFYAFAPYLGSSMPAHWTICDVPAVATAGRALAQKQQASGVHFVSSLGDAGAADIFFAAGSLQYLEPTCTSLLQQLPALPTHVVINKLPTHPTRDFVTVQHIGVGYCPYRITAQEAIPSQLTALGYRLRDTWTNPDLTCIVPFEENAGPITYRGYCFTLA